MKEKGNHIAPHIFRLTNSFHRFVDSNFDKLGISSQQARLLNYICEKEKEGVVYQKNIESEFCIRRSSVTNLLQALENNGLIIRSNCDARSKDICTTEKGKELSKKGKKIIDECEKNIKLILSEEEINSLIFLTDKLFDGFNAIEVKE